MLQVKSTRSTVTTEDRRHALLAARSRRPSDVAKIPNESFIRNMLKDRMGWRRTEPAPQGIKDAAKELAGVIRQEMLAKKVVIAEAKTADVDKAEMEHAQTLEALDEARKEAAAKKAAEEAL